MSRARSTHGFTLIEVMLVMTISLVVFGATLTAFTNLTRANRQAELQRDNLDEARLAMERGARQLRNLANPNPAQTTTIGRADDLDFIFQTSDPAKTWVRYCLQTTNGATPESARLWQSESTALNLSTGMQGTCPGTGWDRQQIAAEHITNQASGADRNVFAFSCSSGQPATCPASAADYSKITSVGFELYLDRDRADGVREQRVATAVFLRNQNELPIAQIKEPVDRTGPRRVVLNGTGSSDPEGRTLQYFWFKSAAPPAAELADCTKAPPSAAWEGAVFNHEFPAADGPTGTTTKSFWLAVRDPGCLSAVAGPVEVTIPS